MDLGNGYKMIKIGGGYALHVPVIVIDKKTKKEKQGHQIHYYGCVYQALNGFLRHSMEDPDTVDALRDKIKATIQKIRDLEAQIKDEFSIKILVSKP